jgi:hypothetical protein
MRKKSMFFSGLFIVSLHLSNPVWAIVADSSRPRVIITADPELDDNNSLIRFILYSASFEIEGLIYSSSQFHWKGDGKGTRFMVPGREYTRYGLNLCPCESYRWKKDERFMHEVVEAYEKVYPNLVLHDPLYPSPDLLKSKIRYGNIEFEGDFSKDTEGSDLIKSVLLDDKPGPVYVTAWGGQSTIARALKSIDENFSNKPEWRSIKEKVSRKLVILPSGEQDNTYVTYIKPYWPDVDYRKYENGPNYGYGAQLMASKENGTYLTAQWMQEHITSKGPLGERYRVWGDGKQLVEGDRFDYFGLEGYTNEQLKQMGYVVWMPVQEKGSWLGEGDTKTFMNLIPNGLEAMEKGYPGGWGGRPFQPNEAYVDPFSNDTSKVKDLVISASSLKKMSSAEKNTAVFPDFFAAAQHDFAARMQWSMTGDRKGANHPPRVLIKGEQEIQARPGQEIRLRVQVEDPDGDAYTIKWWTFLKDQYTPEIELTAAGVTGAKIHLPQHLATGQTLYVVVEVTDRGTPALTRYQLVRIKI